MNDWDEEPAELAAESFETAKPVQVQSIAIGSNGTSDPESYVISCCLLDDGATLDKAVNAGLLYSHFKSQRHAKIYSTLTAMRDSKAPIALDSLVDFAGPRIFELGGIVDLMALADPTVIGTTARAGYYISRVLQDASNRAETNRAKIILERAEKGEDVGPAPGIKTDPRKLLQSLRVSIAKAPLEPKVRLFLAGKPIATPGNIQTLISRAKTGKTATIGGVIAAIIAAHHDRTGLDTLGFTAPHTKEAVVLIDTEQSPYDAFICHRRAMNRAAEENDPSWLCHYAAVGYGVKELRELFVAALVSAKQDHGGVFIAILDGVADFVNSVNDEQECNEFQTWLRALSIDYDCPILCVIHSNEAVQSGDDGRGHLGKQLTRKAESNLLLKKEDGITTITSEKQRKAPITEDDGIRFEWSASAERHVTCKAPEKKSGATVRHRFIDYLSVFPTELRAAKKFPELHRLANNKRPIANRTFWALVEQASIDGEVLVDKMNINEPKYYVAPVV